MKTDRLEELTDRFFDRVVEINTECWLWNGRHDKDGYALWDLINFFGRRETRTARISFALYYGYPVPDEMQVDHLCRNRGCVNPEHLESVTNRENTLRGSGVAAINAAKTCCKRGHEFNESNTYYRPDGTGRACRTCYAEYASVYVR